MQEIILKCLALFSRYFLNFNGKFRIGAILQKVIMGEKKWRKPEFFVKLKDGSKILIDVRSDTHLTAFWCGLYDTALIYRLMRFFKPNWIIFDIGASTGYYSIPFALRIKQIGGMVYSFEPVGSNHERLIKAIEVNGVGSFINAYKIGLGESNATLGISMTEKGNTGNAVLTNELLIKERGFFPTEFVNVVRLDDFVKNNSISTCHFIKIDIEGAEIFFLRGAKNFLTKNKPIIYGEFNSYFFKKFNVTLKEAWDFFENLNYKFYQLNSNPINIVQFKKIDHFIEGLENLILIPPHLDNEDVTKLLH